LVYFCDLLGESVVFSLKSIERELETYGALGIEVLHMASWPNIKIQTAGHDNGG
jgi:hypothetical protein